MILPYRVQINENSVSKNKNNSSCCLQVSIGSPAYEGEKLHSLIQWSLSKYKDFFLFVNDTLQRHNYLEIEENLRYTIASSEGDKWVERNKSYLPTNNDSIRIGIVHWERWLKDLQLQKILKDVNNLYQTDIHFKKTVEQDIKDYTARKQKRGIDLKYEKNLYKSCLDYILEEVAVYEVQQLRYGSINIHAGSQLNIFKLFKETNKSDFKLSQREAIYVNLKRRR